MKTHITLFTALLLAALNTAEAADPIGRPAQAIEQACKTAVAIVGDKFHINSQPTYKDRVWNGHRVEGLLLNSRMVHGHHIVMKGKGHFETENKEARAILCKRGIDPFIDIENLCFSPNWCHSKEYATEVLKRLKAADKQGRKFVIQALKKLCVDHRGGMFAKPGVVLQNTDE